ncbi:MAG: hypothetical protein ACI4VF_08430 [Lachnospirales bacterium]
MEKKYNVLKCVYTDIFLWFVFVLPILFVVVLFLLGDIKTTTGAYIISSVYFGIECLLLLGYVVFKFIYGIKNIIFAVNLYRNNDEDTLFKYAKKAKYGAIWIFVINFILNFFVWFILAVGTRGMIIFGAFIIIFLIIAMTYLDVLFTSCFAIALILLKKVKGEVTLSFTIFNIIFLLCFVIDVLDTIYLHIKFRKKEKINEV